MRLYLGLRQSAARPGGPSRYHDEGAKAQGPQERAASRMRNVRSGVVQRRSLFGFASRLPRPQPVGSFCRARMWAAPGSIEHFGQDSPGLLLQIAVHIACRFQTEHFMSRLLALVDGHGANNLFDLRYVVRRDTKLP